MANGPAAFYLAGSLDGSRPGVFYVNTFKYSSQPKYEMISLSMHEAEFTIHILFKNAIKEKRLGMIAFNQTSFVE